MTEPRIASSNFESVDSGGSRVRLERALAAEMPVAIEVNGATYAVMMASPAQIEDFATGFVLSERLAESRADILEVEAHRAGAGMIARVTLAATRTEMIFERVRHRTSDSACGLCGIDSLEAALRPLPKVRGRSAADAQPVFAALASLRAHQPLNSETGAVHAAALCAADGAIRLVREDVGRHNAFDKLIGAMARNDLDWDGGFALLSSRCSYDLVEKAVLSGCPLLATISAPTALAVERARAAGLALAVLARSDSLLWLAGDAE